ncbi:MAG: DUF4062 domain-containing protein [Colwellia sp.]|nr:DUF4062 domain-containing protein [Colwellia sp.]
MDIKHQVFVSSTYKDLIEERREVIHALLELDCIPAGMELFPATDEDAWSLIKEIIDNCDYYILIIAGKYGSISPEGIGYTEMEFDYAIETNKPILSFIFDELDNLPSSKVEKTELAQSRLNKFRDKAQKKHCKFWRTAHDLGGKVSRSLVQLKKKHPSDGWVPGRYAADAIMLREFEEMRSKLAELELINLKGINNPPVGSKKFSQGKSLYTIHVDLKHSAKGALKSTALPQTWDEIFSYCGSILNGECTDKELISQIKLCFWHAVPDKIEKFNSYPELSIPQVYFDKIKLQLQALGLIMEGEKKRAVSNVSTYWQMTPYSKSYLIQISAIKT